MVSALWDVSWYAYLYLNNQRKSYFSSIVALETFETPQEESVVTVLKASNKVAELVEVALTISVRLPFQ